MKTNSKEYVKNYPILTSVFRITPETIFVKNTEFVYIAVSEKFAQSVGKESAAEVIGKTDFEIYDYEVACKHRKEDAWILETRQNIENIIEKNIDCDETVRYDSISKYFLSDDNGDALGIYGIQYDVTQDVLAKQRFEEEIRYLFEADDNAISAYLINVDDWKIVGEDKLEQQSSMATSTMTMEEYCKKMIEGISSVESEAYHFYCNFSSESMKIIYRGGRRHILMNYQRIMPGGGICWVQDDLRFINNPENGQLFLAIITRDIEGEKQREQELVRRAETDSLTGLLNRAAYLKKVKDVLEYEHNAEKYHALFILDVDNFKKLNDECGHYVGDQFLIQVAEGIKRCFRNTDIIGRLGGDEFLILMRHTPGNEITQKNANRLRDTLNEICNLYHIPELAVSIGISNYPIDGTTFEDLYQNADEALYRAKKSGKNKIEFYST